MNKALYNTRTSHLGSTDRLLFYGFLAWFVCSFVLSTLTYINGAEYEMTLMVQGSADELGYPSLDFSPFEKAGENWQVGDELRRIDGVDTQGMSTLSTYALLSFHSVDGSAQLLLNRQGQEFLWDYQSPRSNFSFVSLFTSFVFALCGAIAFLGAPVTYVTRSFYAGCMSMGINSTYFHGLSVDFTLLWVVSYLLASVVIAVWGFKAVAAFPNGPPPSTLRQRLWPWLLGVCLVVPAMGVLANAPVRAEVMAPVRLIVFSIAGVLAVWLVTRNYQAANNEERGQLKWVLLGTYLMFVPLCFVTALAVFSEGYTPLHRLMDLTNLAYPVCWLIAILGYRAFDVDRVFSAVMTYTISAGIALALIVGLLPTVAEILINRTELQPQMVYVLLSLLVCGALIPLHRNLRPKIESLFFPQRLRLESAARRLSAQLEDSTSESELLDTLSNGLATLQGVARVSMSGVPRSSGEGYELVLQPSVGETVYIHLGEKPSGDIFSERDAQVMARLRSQSESLLLKMRNQALTLQRQAAVQLAAEKSLFLASASHDLRQPMHALGLFSESLVARNRDERLDVLVQQIHRSTRTLDSMFNSILDLSKIDAGAMVPEFGPVYVQLLFEELELEFAAAAQDKGLTLVFSPSSAVISSDANLLARVLRNLISNAIRYTDVGKILVGCRNGEDSVRLQVLDTGRGIDESDRGRIFTPYARVDKHIEGGLGLGLSLVDKLCTLLDHPLTLQSTEGRGSRFSITVAKSVQSAKLAPEISQISWPQPASVSGLRVLAVDDDPAIRLGLTELLTGWGCHIETQDSLSSTFDWLASDPVLADLVLVDLHLDQRQDGLRVLERLYEKWGPVPAVLITGDAQSGTYKWVSGVQVAIMNKPLGPEKLRATMQDALSRKPIITLPLTTVEP